MACGMARQSSLLLEGGQYRPTRIKQLLAQQFPSSMLCRRESCCSATASSFATTSTMAEGPEKSELSPAKLRMPPAARDPCADWNSEFVLVAARER
mmetsp:Transcript_7898/g.18494  ORF Transcript_7898/g.18494 Transcript_7898/m.18494 type:complete len:96 (+) Transcript_7898:31-318(+)